MGSGVPESERWFAELELYRIRILIFRGWYWQVIAELVLA
jgi:hypothetical protein